MAATVGRGDSRRVYQASPTSSSGTADRPASATTAGPGQQPCREQQRGGPREGREQAAQARRLPARRQRALADRRVGRAIGPGGREEIGRRDERERHERRDRGRIQRAAGDRHAVEREEHPA